MSDSVTIEVSPEVQAKLDANPGDYYFGACPKCGGHGRCHNVNRHHWNVCETCNTAWPIGSNLFSAWREETQEQWDRAYGRVARADRVEPAFPSKSAIEAMQKAEQEELQAYPPDTTPHGDDREIIDRLVAFLNQEDEGAGDGTLERWQNCMRCTLGHILNLGHLDHMKAIHAAARELASTQRIPI